jgi:ABC-2 type transport system permease protein
MKRHLISLLALMRKEYQQAFRDTRMVALLFGVPLIQLVVFGYAVDLDVVHLPTVICDLDNTNLSRRQTQRLLATEVFSLARSTKDPEAASRALETGEAQVAVIFPPGYAAALGRGMTSEVQVLVDGTNPNVAAIAQATAVQFFAERSVEILQGRLRDSSAAMGRSLAAPVIALKPRVYYNPQLKSPIFMVPGVAATVLLIVTTILTALGIAKERQVGTMEQVMVTPIQPIVLILGKSLPFALIGYIDVAGILVMSNLLFHVPLQGSRLLLAVATGLYLMSTLGMGLFVSTISRSAQQAVLGGFFVILPSILLSGFVSPVSNMPEWLQPLTMVNPVRHFVEILRASLLKNAGWADLRVQLISLGVFGPLILGVSALRFRKDLA